ncbi:MAG: right-handed parallel beta-helix repeat-containing protein [Candidatus Micrarchaeia archaeon]|jgi:hypothetical protein
MKRLLFLIFTLSAICFGGDNKRLEWFYDTSTLIATPYPSTVTLSLSSTGLGTMAMCDSTYIKSLISLKLNTADVKNGAYVDTVEFGNKFETRADTNTTKHAITLSYAVDNFCGIASATNWNTAYSDRLKWDGGSTGLIAATGRTSLELGTIALCDSAYIKSLIAAGTGTGTVTSITKGIGIVSGRAIMTTGTIDVDTVTAGSGIVNKTRGDNQYQPKDADLTTYAGITPSANAQTLLGETFAQMRGSIGAPDSTLSRDTIYTDATSKVVSKTTLITVEKASKAAHLNLDTTSAGGVLTKTRADNQYIKIDSIATLRAELNARMDSINALRDHIDVVESAANTRIDSLIAAFIVFAGQPPADATNYYLSPTGNDDYGGHAATQPWLTIDKLNTQTFSPGDSIFIASGTYRGQINIKQNGTSALPIVVTRYSTGTANISGADIITGWVTRGTNLWVTHTTSDIYDLYVAGVQQTLARLPNANTYYRVLAGATTTKIRATELGTIAEDGLVGCNISVLVQNWYCNYGKTVISNKDDSIAVSSAVEVAPTTGFPLYLDGYPLLPDTVGEFCFNTTLDSLYLYSVADPNGLTVEGVTRHNGLWTDKSYLKIENLQFEKQDSAGIKFDGTPQYDTVKYCRVWKQYRDGIRVSGDAKRFSFFGNDISLTHGTGIWAQSATSWKADSNKIHSIGLTYGKYYAPRGLMNWADSVVYYRNTIDSTASNGMYARNYSDISYNHVEHYMARFDDGGGIYLGDGNHTVTHHNYFAHGIKYTPSSGTPASASLFAIYYDSGIHNSRIHHNVIHDGGWAAIFNQYTNAADSVDNNLIHFSSGSVGYGIWTIMDSTYHLTPEYVVKNNRLYTNNATTNCHFSFWQDRFARWHSWRAFGTWDYNEYVNPRGWATPFVYTTPAGSYSLTLTQVRDSLAGQEINSTLGYYGTTGTDIVDSLFVNSTDVSQNFTIQENYWKDPVSGAYIATPIVLAPDSGLIAMVDPINEIDTVLAANRNGRSTGTDEALDYPRVGQSAAGDELQSGFEFCIKALDGKTIDSAFFQWGGGGGANWSTDDIALVWVVDEDNAAVYNAADVHTIYNHHSGYVGASSVEWTFAGSGTAWYTSPNIGAKIQAVIDRGGFADGNYIGIVITAKTPTTNNFFYGQGFTDSGVANAPRLKVYYH